MTRRALELDTYHYSMGLSPLIQAAYRTVLTQQAVNRTSFHMIFNTNRGNSSNCELYDKIK